MAKPIIPIFRIITLSLSLFFTFILLGLSAHLLSSSLASGGGGSGNSDTDDTLDQFDIPHRRALGKRLVGDGGSQDYEGLGIATGVLSLLAFGTLIGMGLFRRGSFVSWNIVELGVLGFMTLLWIAESGLAVSGSVLNYPDGCSLRSMNQASQVYCNELHGLQGVAFLTWLLLLAYIITNLIFSFRQGRGVWKTSVSEAFSSSGGGGRIPIVRTGSGFDDGFEKDRMALPGGGGYGQQQQQQQYAPVSTYNDGTYTGYDGRTQVHV